MAAITRNSSVHLIAKCIVIVLFVFQTHSAQADNSLKISAPPSIWVQDQNGLLTGPLITLIDDIFSQNDISISAAPLPWARAIAQLKSGKLDMIPVIFYTENRAEFMDFTTSFAVVPTSIFVPTGKTFTYSSVSDLRDKKGVIMRGDSISVEFEQLKDQLDLTEIAAYGQMIQMLADNRADYAVAAQYGFIIQAKKLQYDRKIEMLPKPVASRNLHFAISKKSPYVKYVPMINQKLQQLRVDGQLDRLVDDTLNNALEK